MYKYHRFGGVVRQDDGATIPEDPGNRDWDAFVAWRDGGGVPEDADPEPTDAARIPMGTVIARATGPELAVMNAMRDAMQVQALQQAEIGDYEGLRFLLAWQYAPGNTINPNDPRVLNFLVNICEFGEGRVAELLSLTE